MIAGYGAPMRGKGDVTWERVDSLVDRQINAEKLHVWPFPYSYPIDVRFLILDRWHDVPMHRPDHLEVVVFESGELGYEVEDRTCMLHKNDVIVVGDRIRHRCLPRGNSQREARAVVLSFLPQIVHSGPVDEDAQYLMPFMLLDSPCPNVVPAQKGLSRDISDFVQRIHSELPAISERSRLSIKTCLKMILMALVNYYAEVEEAREAVRRRQRSVSRLGPVLEHLERRYDEPMRVDDAARLCAMSACCFMQLFKEAMGQSFVAYLNNLRVSRAKGLLAWTSKSIADISLETGFCNQSYFGVVFRRITGVTPLAYRLNYRGGQPSGLQTAVSPPSTVKMPPTQ
jgi:AraC-like DNA-binding protein